MEDIHFAEKVARSIIGQQANGLMNWEDCFAFLEISPNTILERTARPATHLYLVETGWLRLHTTDAKGHDQTMALATKGDWITDFATFVHQQPSSHTVSSVGHATAYRIEHGVLLKLLENSKPLQTLMLRVFEQGMAHAAGRNAMLVTKTASERYYDLLETRPHWLQELPLRMVASYLGMRPESLSRIRAKKIS